MTTYLAAERGMFETVEPDAEASPGEAFYLPQEGAADPRPIIARLVENMPEFNHLRIGEAVVMVVMRGETKISKGRQVLGEIALPRFQGSLGAFALWLLAKTCGNALPDYVLLLDSAFWSGATDLQREALIHHELMHAQQAKDKEGEPRFDDNGIPVWAIEGHSLEEHNQTVRRYGAWLGDITAFLQAAHEGGATP